MPITFIMLIIVGRPTNFQQTLDLSFAHFTRGQLTDVCLVPEQGEGVRVHGFMLSAASPFLREVLANTFSPNLEYTILLPGRCCLELETKVIQRFAKILQ